MEGAPAESATAPVSPPPAPAPETPSVEPKVKAPAHFEDEAGLFKTVCRMSMNKKCTRDNCEYVHDKKLCKFFWRTGECKFGAECKHNHFVTITPKIEEEEKVSADAAAKPAKAKTPKDKSKKDESKDKSKEKPKKDESKEKSKKDESKDKPKKDGKSKAESKKDGKSMDESKKDGRSKDESKSKSEKVRTVKGKNTEVFEPMTKPVDLRVTYDLGGAADAFSTPLTSRDVLLAPNIFNDFAKGELYAKLLQELEGCGVPEERLLKMWHGNDKIDGTHLIADDKTRWKTNCPTFQLVIDRLAKFFSMKVQATRFNWYKDTSQWKPFHFDAAAVKPEIAAKQNFTIGVSFGATRDAAFEHAKTRTVVSLPQPDSCVYAFARDTNIIWRHGILQDVPVRQEGRISVIAWGWIDGMTDPLDATPASEAK